MEFLWNHNNLFVRQILHGTPVLSDTGDVYKIHSWDNGKKQAIATLFSPLTSYEGIQDMKFLVRDNPSWIVTAM